MHLWLIFREHNFLIFKTIQRHKVPPSLLCSRLNWAGWGVLTAGQHRGEEALLSALTASEKWLRTANTLPASISQSQLLQQKRWRMQILANRLLLPLLPEAQQQKRQGTKIFLHCAKAGARGPSLMDRPWAVLGITSFTLSPSTSITVPESELSRRVLREGGTIPIWPLNFQKALGKICQKCDRRLRMGNGRSGRCATPAWCDVHGGADHGRTWAQC